MSVPADRLTAADLYHSVSRIETAFAEGDDEIEIDRGGRLRLVSTVDERIGQLVRVIAHLRDPHYSEAMELVDELKRARISRNVNLPEVFGELRRVIAGWEAAREARRRARAA